jgi:hypothetical protein
VDVLDAWRRYLTLCNNEFSLSEAWQHGSLAGCSLIQGPICTRRHVFYIPGRLSQEDSDKHSELFAYIRDGFYKNTMELSVSWEANSRSAGQEFPRPSIEVKGSLPRSPAVIYRILALTQSLQLNDNVASSNMFTLSCQCTLQLKQRS